MWTKEARVTLAIAPNLRRIGLTSPCIVGAGLAPALLGWCCFVEFIDSVRCLAHIHWPWLMLLPLALAIVSTSRRTTLLAMLLTMGAVLEYYFLLWPKVWPALALVTIGLPLLVWALFFTSTWQMTRPEVTGQPLPGSMSIRRFSFSRPPLPSRPSWLGRRK